MSIEGTLSHVEINVTRLAEAADFYDWFLGRLGYRPYQHWELGRSWRLGDTYIVVVQVEEPYERDGFHRKRAGLNHLAFHAAGRAVVDEMRAELAARGIPLLYGGPIDDEHAYALYFEGPDRLKLEYGWRKR